MGRVATTGVFLLFPNGFYVVTTGWISEIGLGKSSINQSIERIGKIVARLHIVEHQLYT